MADIERIVELATAATAALEVYEKTGNLDSLQRAIMGYEEALTALPRDHIVRESVQFGLGRCLHIRAVRIDHPSDLEQAFVYIEEIVGATPRGHPDRAKYVTELASMLALRGDTEKDINDLQRSIDYHEETLTATPENDPQRADHLARIILPLCLRGIRLEDIRDFEQSVRYCREVDAITPVDHPDRAKYFSRMANGLIVWYNETEELSDLAGAMIYFEAAVTAMSPDHPERAQFLSDLGTRLHLWYPDLISFDGYRSTANFERAMMYLEEARSLLPIDGLNRMSNLCELALLSSTMHTLTIDFDYLNQSIMYQERVVIEIEGGHPRKRDILSQLVEDLMSRFDNTNDITDVHNGIRYAREALEQTPLDHSNRANCLIDLGILLGERFQLTEDMDDFEQGISYFDEAVGKPILDPLKQIDNIDRLCGFFAGRDAEGDCERVIQLSNAVLSVIPSDDIRHAEYLYYLSEGLSNRFYKFDKIEDLEQAIIPCEAAAKVGAEASIYHGTVLAQLMCLYAARYEYLFRACEEYTRAKLDEGLEITDRIRDLCRQVWECPRLPYSMRVAAIPFGVLSHAMDGAMRSLGPTNDESFVLSNSTYYTELQAFTLLIRDSAAKFQSIVPRTLNQQDQETRLNSVADAASHNSCYALEGGLEPYEVLQLLERSRGVIIGLDIDCRSEILKLEETYPNVAAKFNELRKAVDTVSLGRTTTISGMVESTFEQVVAYHHSQAQAKQKRETNIRKMEEMLVEIRNLPGHDQFQRPPSAEALMEMAKQGPIVTLTVNPQLCFAIIITRSKISTLPIHGGAQGIIPKWGASPKSPKKSKRKKSPMKMYIERNEKMRADLLWLWDFIVEPVLRELNFIDPPVNTKLPHIWWIGVGPFSSAPFHAAGDHSLNSTRNTLSCVISSYTSTLKTLSYSRERELAINNPQVAASLLLVSMAKTPDEKDLPDVDNEIAEILNVTEGLVSAKHLNSPSAAQVLDHIGTSNVMHFACHGVSDAKLSSKSHLILLKPSGIIADKLTVESISRNNTKSSEIAYLSACSTARTSSGLDDERIHIASGFQVAGFRHVLATLWPSESKVCKEIAVEFYRSLFNGQDSDAGHMKVSMAFHESVKKARDKSPLLPCKWAPFIHMGA